MPQLAVINDGPIAVLIIDGEELIGAKQNRVLNTTVLLKERSKTVIPVSCTEQGRWQWRSAESGGNGRGLPPPGLCRPSREADPELCLRGPAQARGSQALLARRHADRPDVSGRPSLGERGGVPIHRLRSRPSLRAAGFRGQRPGSRGPPSPSCLSATGAPTGGPSGSPYGQLAQSRWESPVRARVDDGPDHGVTRGTVSRSGTVPRPSSGQTDACKAACDHGL